MKFLLLIVLLYPLGSHNNSKNENPDLKMRLVEGLSSTAEVVIIQNHSALKAYTVVMRRKEVYYKYSNTSFYNKDGSFNWGDTIVLKRDTLVRFATMVIPPRTWRWVGENFCGESTTTMSKEKNTRVETGFEKKFRYKIISAKVGGNVNQMYNEPDPFNKEGKTNMSMQLAMFGHASNSYFGKLPAVHK